MPESLSGEGNPKSVGEVLKKVDELIKRGDLREALIQVDRVSKIDPGNLYIRAYQERIFELWKAAEKKQPKGPPPKAITDMREQLAKDRAKLDEERRKREEELHKLEIVRKNLEPKNEQKQEEKQKNHDEVSGATVGTKAKPAEEIPMRVEQRGPEESSAVEEERRRLEEDVARQREETRKNLELAAQHKLTEQRAQEAMRRRGEEARREEEEKRKLEEEEFRKQERLKQEGTRHFEEERQELEQELVRQEEEAKRIEAERRKSAQTISSFVNSRDEALSIYRRALSEAWANGVPAPDQQTKLATLRAALDIALDVHEKFLKEIKQHAYLEAFRRFWSPSGKSSSGKDDAMWLQAFRRAWKSGTMSPQRTAALDQIRKQFQISTEEYLKIESSLLAEARASSRKPTIIAIDDDEKLLYLITTFIEEAGFDIKTFTTSDDALEALNSFSPDLILCDINLPTSKVGGFTFYEKIREMNHLKFVPFIFLTAMTDDALIRSGKELGVDDYITKPFDDEYLLATIKGKVKRYREMRSA